MEKTRLGITIKLFGAGLYFLGLMSIVPLVLAAGYVLLFEDNQWLQRVAVKAVAVVIFFTVLFALLGLFSDASGAFHNLINMTFSRSVDLRTINGIIGFIRNALSIIQVLVLLLLGFRALKMRDVGVPAVDKTINDNM